MGPKNRSKEPVGEASGFRYEVRDASPPAIRQLRQSIRGSHWSYGARQLEILAWVCGTDRQYEKARAALLELIKGEEAALMAIVSRLMPEGDDDAAAAG